MPVRKDGQDEEKTERVDASALPWWEGPKAEPVAAPAPKSVTPQVPAMPGMTPLGFPVVTIGAKPAVPLTTSTPPPLPSVKARFERVTQAPKAVPAPAPEKPKATDKVKSATLADTLTYLGHQRVVMNPELVTATRRAVALWAKEDRARAWFERYVLAKVTGRLDTGEASVESVQLGAGIAWAMPEKIAA